MKKIALNLDALEVSTFETAAAELKHGTVQANDASLTALYTCDPRQGTCFGYTCVGAGPGCTLP
jgi:hypothetical protein